MNFLTAVITALLRAMRPCMPALSTGQVKPSRNSRRLHGVDLVMSRNFILLSLIVYIGMIGYAREAMAQDTTTIVNTTNACINSTFKSYSPYKTNPTAILIDRRITFNPVTGCVTAGSNNANCNRDGGSMLLGAAASGMEITMNPSCSWDCAGAGCGTITTGTADGLPVELMEFSVGQVSMEAVNGEGG